nr:MAG TPA_asm: hypothetical protein [Caudoviricetes sp.]
MGDYICSITTPVVVFTVLVQRLISFVTCILLLL